MTMTNVKDIIATLIIDRKARDAKLAESGQARSKSYCAFFATDAFANTAESYAIDLKRMFDLCDKTLNRLELFLKAIAEDKFYQRNESDQNRYTYNIVRTMINAHNAKVAMITKSDTFACGQKVEGANEYVAVHAKHMSDTTTARQTGIALYVLECLNVCTVQRVGKNIIGYKVNDKSAMYKRLSKMVKAEQAAMNS